MNKLKQYLQSKWQRSSPKRLSLEQELVSIREAHAGLNAGLEKVDKELQQAREQDAQVLAKLNQQLKQIESERIRTREQIEHLKASLADTEQHRKSTEGRVDTLETMLKEEHGSTHEQVAQVQDQLTNVEQHLKSTETRVDSLDTGHGEERSRHEANLQATQASLARIQEEQLSLDSKQSRLTGDLQGISTRLQELQQAAVSKPQQSRLMSAVITGVLLVAGVLAGVFIMQGLQDRSQELAMVEQDIRDMHGFMKERIDRQDESLNDLALALNRQTIVEPTPAVEVPPVQEPVTQEADDQQPDTEAFIPDIRELQAGLMTLGYDLGIPEPNGEAGVKTRQALQEFRQFYHADSDRQDYLASEPLAALILKSADMLRTDAARFNIRRDVLAAIQLGSIRTGVDFSFLMELARIESNFNPAARAPRSSATGLFQFRDHAWLDSIRAFGPDYGLQDYASRVGLIDNGESGQEPIVRDPLQLEVLALRLNPRLSALMMAESIKRNLQILLDSTGQEPGRTDLYLAHFLGPDNAVMFLEKLDKDPSAIAADLFPQEAETNPVVFRSQRQSPRTVADVYRRFERMFNTGRYDVRNPG